jgi:hypothetical protein
VPLNIEAHSDAIIPSICLNDLCLVTTSLVVLSGMGTHARFEDGGSILIKSSEPKLITSAAMLDNTPRSKDGGCFPTNIFQSKGDTAVTERPRTNG